MDTGIYHALPYPLKPSVMSRSRQITLDYFSLLKPRVVLLHLFTATTAMFLAAGGLPRMKTAMLVLLGGGLVAGAANTLNCYFDRDLDKTMPRTQNRPLPSGRLEPFQALIFGLACAVVGLSLLTLLSFEAAALALFALSFYAIVYTLWLKRSSSLSAVLSSGIGAVPPLIGWIAVSGHLAATPFLLFGIIALWTPPHFWALAASRGEEYQKAGLNVIPGRGTNVWMAAFLLALLGASLALGFAAKLGAIYFTAAAMFGLVFNALSLHKIQARGNARRLYVYSIVYLAALFAAMILDRLILS
jgi:protoheme IX farnesyltransferase